MTRIAIVGASVRAAAQSALRAGFDVVGADLFAAAALDAEPPEHRPRPPVGGLSGDAGDLIIGPEGDEGPAVIVPESPAPAQQPAQPEDNDQGDRKPGPEAVAERPRRE